MAAVGDRQAQGAALLNVMLDGGRPGPRVATISLEELASGSTEDLAHGLRERHGPEPLDFLVLGHPVVLGADWRDNNFDHALPLLGAWSALESLVDAGVAHAPGICHAGEAVLDLLRERAQRPPAVDLIEHHPYLRSDGPLAAAKRLGVQVFALRALGPPAASFGYEVLDNPVIGEVAARHGCTPVQVVLRWAFDRLDAVVLDAYLGTSLDLPPDLELSADDTTALDALDCGFRIEGEPSILASLFGQLSANPVQVGPASTDGLSVGCHKVLYAQVTPNEAFNRRFSFFVWRNVFNLPASVSYNREEHDLSEVSERIHADLERDGFAFTDVRELGCELLFKRVRDEAAARVEDVQRKEAAGKHSLYRYVAAIDSAQELAEVPALTDAIDAYCGLRTHVDSVTVITIPGRLAGATKQQLWHSDLEDLFTVKAYTYLTDVDALSGSLDYIAETHPKGRFAVETAELWKRSFVQDPTPDYSFQVPDELLFRHVRPDLMQRLEGPAGTVVVFDARGLHRGGHVLKGLRQVAVTSHTAPNQAHPWRGERSAWRTLTYPFRWETNVTLRDGPTPLRKRIARSIARREDERPGG